MVHSITNVGPSSLREMGPIHSFSQSAKNAATELFQRAISLEPKVPEKEETVNIILLSDFDASDWNGAIMSDLIQTYSNNVLITTRSMISGAGLDRNNEHQHGKVVNNMIEWKNNFHIFELRGSELLLFIPKKLHSDSSDQEKLRSLGFVSDKTLKEISALGAFKAPNGKNKIEDFYRLFDTSSSIRKNILIHGHGGENNIGGINKKDYQQFLRFLNENHTSCLSVSSCYGGGTNTLEYMPELDDSDDTNDSPLKFPVLVLSIGDFVTNSSNKRGVIERLNYILKSGNLARVNDFSIVLGSPSSINNQSKALLPHKKGIPNGFRYVQGGQKKQFELTYTMLQQYQLQLFDTKPIVRVDNRESFGVYPMLVSCPVEFTSRIPVMISQIPGKSHHLFHSIHMPQGSLEDLITKTKKFYKEVKFNSRTLFLISEFVGKDQNLNNVVVDFNKGKVNWMYRENGKYYVCNSEGKIEISETVFALELLNKLEKTKPSEKALRMASAGLENEDMLREKLFLHQFWKGKESMPKPLQVLLDTKDPNLQDKILEEIKPGEKEVLLFYAIDQQLDSLVMQLIEDEEVDLNALNTDGYSLLIHCMISKRWDVVEKLLEKGVNANTKSPISESNPLHFALFHNKKDLAKQLIETAGTDVHAQNRYGLTALTYALDDELMQLLISQGVKIDQQSKLGLTPLGLAVSLDDSETIERLIRFGADPNAGETSPLIEAINRRSVESVRALVNNGADPTTADGSGTIPLIQAALMGNSEILSLLLEHESIDFEKKDRRGLNLIEAGFNTLGDDGLFLKIYRRKAELQGEDISEELRYYEAFQNRDIDTIKELIRNRDAFHAFFQTRLALNCFSTLVFHEDLEILEILFENGISPSTATKFFETPISFGLLVNNQDMIKLCLKFIDKKDVPDFLQTALKNTTDNLPEEFLEKIEDPFMIITPKGQKWYRESIMSKLIKQKKDIWVEKLLEKFDIMQAEDNGLIELYAAVGSKQMDIAKALIIKGVKPFEATSPEESPFGKYMAQKNQEMIDFCLMYSAPPKVVESRCSKISFDTNNFDVVEKLIKKGANPYVSEKPYKPSFFESLVVKNRQDLIDFCLDTFPVTTTEDQGTSALIHAAGHVKEDNGQTFRKLLDKGVKISNCETAFKEVVKSGKIDLIRLAVENGAKVTDSILTEAASKENIFHFLYDISTKQTGNSHSNLSTSVFNSIVRTGNIKRIEWALDHGAQLLADEKASQTPLSAAIRSGNITVFRYLLEKAKEQKIISQCLNQVPTRGNSAFVHAVGIKNIDLVKECVANGAEINPTAVGLQTPLSMAAHGISDFCPIFDYLLEAGGDLNKVSGDAYSAFLRVVEKGHVDLVKRCVEKGALVNPVDIGEETPLSMASRDFEPNEQVFAYLLEKGADPTVIPKYGDSAFFNVLRKKSLMKLCREMGCELTLHESEIKKISGLELFEMIEDPQTLEKLFSLGVDPRIIDETLIIAAVYSNRESAGILLRQVASLPKDQLSFSPMELAVYLPEEIPYLEERGFTALDSEKAKYANELNGFSGMLLVYQNFKSLNARTLARPNLSTSSEAQMASSST